MHTRVTGRGKASAAGILEVEQKNKLSKIRGKLVANGKIV